MDINLYAFFKHTISDYSIINTMPKCCIWFWSQPPYSKS